LPDLATAAIVWFGFGLVRSLLGRRNKAAPARVEAIRRTAFLANEYSGAADRPTVAFWADRTDRR
jgi:hypothetical protein